MIRSITYDDLGVEESFRFYMGIQYLSHESYHRHSHEFSELAIVRQGSAIHLTDHGNYPIQSGDVFLIQKNMVHGYFQARNLELVNFMFDPQQFMIFSSDLLRLAGYHALFVLDPMLRGKDHVKNRLRLAGTELPAINDQIMGIESEFHQKRAGYQTMLTGLWLRLVTDLCRIFSQQPSGQRPFMRLAKTVAYMENNFQDKVLLEDLAKRSAMSVNQFLRVFKRNYQITPMNYLTQLRLERARELLKDPNLDITEVAFESGFDDSNYFSRVFRKHYQTSPREFRKTMGL